MSVTAKQVIFIAIKPQPITKRVNTDDQGLRSGCRNISCIEEKCKNHECIIKRKAFLSKYGLSER